MRVAGYESYRDSGVEWLGEVPAHWDVKRLKHVGEAITGLTYAPDDITSSSSDGTLVLRSSNVQKGQIALEDNVYVRCQIPEKLKARAGDILICSRNGSRALIGKNALIGPELAGETWGAFMTVFRTSDAPFMYWVMNSPIFTYQAAKFLTATINQLTVGDLNSFEVPVPPPVEQTAIAAFLDRETGKIDALVEAQRRLIELLQEKRQAVISHAVTKGFDPTAAMKDSGVGWLGEVPAHWEVTALRRLCSQITDGAHVSPETENGIYCFVSTRDVSQDGIDFEGCLRTSEASYEYLLRTGCQPKVGDVLFSKDGTIGRTVVVREHRDFVVASSLIIIRPDAEFLDADFLDFLCQSDAVQDQVESFVKGAGLPRLSIANLMRVVGIFPPPPEQRQIARVLAAISARIAALVTEAEAAVRLLQERRAALISAAVTGKIDVRDLAPERAVAA